jgi:hypothetical protein
MFVILTPDRVPLGSAKTKQPRFQESELPSVVLAWLDEAPKEQKVELEPTLEEVENVEVIQPFEVLEMPQEMPQEKPTQKPCPEGKERSPISGLCVKKCEPGEVRSEKGHCKKAAKPVAKVGIRMVVEELECPGQEVSPKSGQCVQPCKEGQLRNPNTGHCIKVAEISPDVDISAYDVQRCEKSKGQSAAFPFKKEDVLEALKEQGIKARKSWGMVELCSYVTNDTLRILARTRKNRNRKVAQPLAKSPDPNMSDIDIALCPKGHSPTFPFKREELLDSLREENVYLARSSTLPKICPHVTQETLRRILKDRATRKNARSM